MNWAQLTGAGIVTIALADVFLTVLFARSGTGLITPRLNRLIWALFKAASPRRGGLRDTILAFAGPTMMVATVSVWFLLLTCGFALIVWPALGTSIQASQGPTPTDFAAALYFSGYSLTTLGTGDIVPQTSGFRILMVLQAFLGFSILTLALTYLMSVYSALVRRNTLAQALHHLSSGTGNAAELVAGLGAGGSFEDARNRLSTLAVRVLGLLESHHSYPVLHYFRLREPRYAMARIALLTMDTATLLRTAFGLQHEALARSGAVQMLWGSGLALLRETGATFLPKRTEVPAQDERSKSDKAARFDAALHRVQAAGIATTSDTAGAFATYTSLREEWVGLTRAFAMSMGHQWDEIEPRPQARTSG
ncbi:hypothetical protein CA262_18570 [Sphingobium sp. GW456-12-10-14-TSB1]|uniref:potassium channel family protein n=1 Tax=Sphingobium sp. GW456-12-10-14-TSB1 TaxID=1987165 RepID=UPI000A3C641B|nr:potassium channel family protein [Sphingobium sp. GW456-12-10-14-TSB1]OUC53680.1 hypothetical protein CA262_18570 [Sphingobium sp. GW456-12-10-14-TSB1]